MMENRHPHAQRQAAIESSFSSFREYLTTDSQREVAKLTQLPMREIGDFVYRVLTSDSAPLPRVIEARMGVGPWEEFKKLAAKIDVDEALWVVAATRYFDHPHSVLSAIVRAVYEVPEPRFEVMGKQFHDRCHEFFVKRLGLFGSHEKATLISASVSDLFRCDDEHSGNYGRVDEGREKEPTPLGWSASALWDRTVRLQEEVPTPLSPPGGEGSVAM